METLKTPDPQIISELVRRIVETVHPLRIILFGSAARGEMNENSDLDVLVIMPDGVHRRRTAQVIYRGLRGLGVAKDVIVATPSDIRDYGGNPSLILYPALREGKEIYHAAG
jgi:predicted nucleotidyltransferase